MAMFRLVPVKSADLLDMADCKISPPGQNYLMAARQESITPWGELLYLIDCHAELIK